MEKLQKLQLTEIVFAQVAKGKVELMGQIQHVLDARDAACVHK
jgi:hypothetical protein